MKYSKWCFIEILSLITFRGTRWLLVNLSLWLVKHTYYGINGVNGLVMSVHFIHWIDSAYSGSFIKVASGEEK